MLSTGDFMFGLRRLLTDEERRHPASRMSVYQLGLAYDRADDETKRKCCEELERDLAARSE